MKVKKLILKNFRCFRQLEVEFNPLVNILVGGNGAGKTAVLDGIVASLAEFSQHAFQYHNSLRFATKDIRINDHGGYEDEASATSILDTGQETTVRISPNSQQDEEFGVVSSIDPSRPNDWTALDSIREEIIKNPSSPVLLPVFAYYRATRNLAAIHPVQTVQNRRNERTGRLAALNGAENAFSDYQHVANWFYQAYVDELFQKEKTGDLSIINPERRAVTEAVVRMIPDAEGIGFTEKSPRRLFLKWKTGDGEWQRRYVSQLSDGYRNMLALVMDFSRRLVQANPHLDSPLDAEALLLIDEIDLHLHPRWQQTILGDLRRAFPNTQIICTTHSPQVLSTAKPEEIFVFDCNTLQTVAGKHSYGVQSNRVLNEIMGVAARPEIPELEQMKQEINAAIRSDPHKTKELLIKLADILGAEDPFIINAQAEIIRSLDRNP